VAGVCRARTAVGSVLAAGLLLTATGCGSGDTTSADEASASQSPTSSATPVDQRALADVEKRLQAAVDAMQEEPVTRFRHAIELFAKDASVTDGLVDADGWQATTTQYSSGGDPQAVMHVRSSGGHVWMQMDHWTPPAKGCWLQMEPNTVPLGYAGMTADEPAYFGVIGALHALRPGEGDAFQGGMDVAQSLSLLGGSAVNEISVDPGHEDVHMRVTLAGGRVSEVLLSGQEIVRAVDAAGGSISDNVRESLPRLSVSLRFPAPTGEESPLVAPPEDKITTDQATIAC
jgi:hypothetical protein